MIMVYINELHIVKLHTIVWEYIIDFPLCRVTILV